MFELFNKFDPKEIENTVKKRNVVLKLFIVFIGITICALSFNLFFVPNNFVSSGLSGVAIIASNYFDFSPIVFIFLGNLIFSLLGIAMLGIKETYKALLGGFTFTLMVYLTQDIPQMLNFSFDNVLLYVLAAGIVSGFGESLIFKMGYSTGGLTILSLVISKYTKRPLGKTIRLVGTFVIIFGGFAFGYTMIMYSLIIVSITTLIIDKVLIGISDSKMFLIITKKEQEIKKYLLEIVKCGVTELESRGAYSKGNMKILMCAISTEKYFSLKDAIKEIDKDAFMIITDCYEVYGGVRRQKLPFNKWINWYIIV